MVNLEKIKAKIELYNYANRHPLKTEQKKVVIDRTNTEKSEILFIGEAPGWQENQEGIPFVGRAGKILNNWILENEIKEYTIINVIPLIPLDEKNKIRPPTDEEIEDFRPYAEKLIQSMKPKIIITLGNTAKKLMKITGLKNKSVIQEKGIIIGCIYHPAYYLRNGKTGDEDFKELFESIKSINQQMPSS